MKIFLIAIMTILFISCKEETKKVEKLQGWTEEQKRKYYNENFAQAYEFGQFDKDSTKTFAYFFKTQYPDIKTKYSAYSFPYALEEEYIDTTKIDSTRNWFRIIVKPCFRHPYCFVVEKKDGKSFLTTKITDGDGGYRTGILAVTLKFPFPDTLYNNISERLHSFNFWRLGQDTSCKGGFDGEYWTIEAIENGKYNLVGRWVPQDCGDSVTKELSKIGFMLGKQSKLDNILTAIGAPKSDL
jgi:hypothetical protein